MTPTNEEIRIQIAESLGWTECYTEIGWVWGVDPAQVSNECGGWCTIPIYPESLDACAEFEKTLTDDEWDVYCENLGGSLRSCASATARQRCLAYLKTKGLLP